jgi:hypothetical protein
MHGRERPQGSHPSAAHSRGAAVRSRRRAEPRLELLEGRQLLALFTGFSHVRNIPTPSGVYSLSIDGPGVLKTTPAGRGTFDVKVLGTSSTSTLTISQVRPRFHLVGGPLLIRNLSINSGQIGGIDAPVAELEGAMTPLNSSPSQISLGGLGRNAQIDVRGSVGTMSLGAVDLGPSGHVVIAGDLTGAGSTEGSQGTTAALTIGQMSLDGGQFLIGRDALGMIDVAGDVSLAHDGLFSTGRDMTGGLQVGGSVTLSTGGEILVGRNLEGLTINGDLVVNPSQGGIVVGGNLDGMSVNGVFRGQGSPSAVDLAVGLNLNNLSVLGGAPGQGSILDANINVGKSINGLNAAHGIFRSWITAGVAINGINVGADGVVAVYNSEIDAGTSITNARFNGDVQSGFPTGDQSGYPTRIIAGKVRGPGSNSTPDQGLYLANGTISDMTITGSLIDAVLAASVAPFGGDGSLPPAPSYGTPPRTSGPPPGVFTNFQAPAGLTGTTPNFSIRNVGGPNADVAAWAQPPELLHDNVLPGGTITVTINGGVTSTQQDTSNDTYDFAGIFAVNTTGVS